MVMSNFLLVTGKSKEYIRSKRNEIQIQVLILYYSLPIPNTMAWGFQKGLGRDFNGFLVEAFFMAAMYLFWSSVMNASKDDPPEKIIHDSLILL